MEKVRYDIKKILAIAVFISVIDFIFMVSTSTFNWTHELRNSSLIAIVIIVSFWYIFHSENTSINNGLYFSHDGVVILRNSKKVNKSWNDVKVKRVIRFFNVFHLITFQTNELSRNYRFMLFSASEKSFRELVFKYVPKDHQLYKFTKDYFKIDER
jgi:hypothetical protein